MELSLTVSDPLAGSYEVVVTCDPAVPVAELSSALQAAMHPGQTGQAATLFAVHRRLDPATPVGDAGIVSGMVLGYGNPLPREIEARSVPVALSVIGGLSAGSVLELAEGTFTIGRQAGCDLVIDDEEVSRLHASVAVAGGQVVLEDLLSANGTIVNGARISAPTVLSRGDLIEVGGSVLTVSSESGAPGELQAAGDGRLRFNKPPRQVLPVGTATFKLPEEPQPPTGRHFSFVVLAAPLILGIAVWAISHRIEFMLFSLASPVMLGANAWSDRRSGRRTYTTRKAEYAAAVESMVERLDLAVRQQEAELRLASPDPASIASIATLPGQRLWERRRDDDDFLFARIGLGDKPANITFTGRAERPAGLHPTTRAVPVTVPLLESGVLGIAGPRELSLRLVRSVVIHLATLHTPTDLSMVLLTAGKTGGWEWIKWLPHIVPKTTTTCLRRVGVATAQRTARVEELVALVEQRSAEQAQRYGRDDRQWPSVLVIVDDVIELRREQSVAYLLQEGPKVGVVSIAIAADRAGLPAETGASVDVIPDTNGPTTLVLTSETTGVIAGIIPDGMSDAQATRIARALAPIFEVDRSSRSGAIPEPPLDQLELLGLSLPTPDAILSRWSLAPSPRNLPALVGVGEDGPLVLDLGAEGPHALIAGTTGAGKSELLQTLVASLAVVAPPDAVTFLLVDFKGGSAFRDCERLPHTLGVISNLDGRLVERALDSLQAELRWRQARFNEVGAKDFEEYASLPPSGRLSIPRLLVVVDELKELADAYREAVVRLNQTARLGRSLGVHLILATQKPSSVAGLSDLRANTDVRICLRVQDEADSRELIDVPDAASIPRTRVGRAIVRFSDGRLVPVQTGYLGGRASPTAGTTAGPRLQVGPFGLATVGDRPLGRAGPSGRGQPDLGVVTEGSSELRVLVAAIKQAGENLGLPRPRLPWLPPLPELLSIDDGRLWGERGLAAFPIALLDLPNEQRQEPLFLDLDDLTHVLVTGPARSGRTTFLRSLAGIIGIRSSVADVHVYAFDFRRRGLTELEQLPQCGAVIGLDEPDRMERCFTFLEGEIERRSSMMLGGWTLAEQRARSVAGDALPYILVLCDNYDAFYERFSYEDGGRLVDRFNGLLSDAPARGIHFVITADRRANLGKVGNSIESRLFLRPVDRDDQILLGLGSGAVPANLPAGRGYWYQGPTEAQVSLLTPVPSGEAQSAAVGEIARDAQARTRDWHAAPVRIPPLPAQVKLAEAITRRRTTPRVGRPVVVLGVGGIDARSLDVDLEEVGSTMVIAGPRGSGRSTALLTIAHALRVAEDPPRLQVVVAVRRSPMRSLDGLDRVRVLTSADSLAGDLADALTAEGPLALLIDDAELLLDSPASSRLDRIVRNGPDNGWLIVVAGTTSDLARRFSGWTFDVRQARTGILLQPSSAADGEILEVRLPRSTGTGRPPPPGRGILVVRGEPTTIQVAAP